MSRHGPPTIDSNNEIASLGQVIEELKDRVRAGIFTTDEQIEIAHRLYQRDLFNSLTKPGQNNTGFI